MATWTTATTTAHRHVQGALMVVDNLLSYVKDTKGKPSVKERALFAAAVVFAYGIWENYVEQLAIELVERVSPDIAPEKVPDLAKKQLEKKTTWELTVSPGWRSLWVANVRKQAIGEDETFGMNTAKAGQVKNLLAQAGVADPFRGIADELCPDHLDGDQSFVSAVNSLVELRGEIVHTGKVPDSLRKKHVLAWRSFVKEAVDGVDETCRAQCKALLS